ncbi:ATP/GTP-binding protein [uncultured Hymenobacter sp.]|uniref:AAA family ATPase n=1 Tax=uncultured Hymenobacter sp. TaxID=170016 RepID=UPI0035C9AFDA
MLKRLHIKNFTVFADADFEFGPGLNVIVGTNGTGKSHVLKLGYIAEIVRFNVSRDFSASQLNAPLISSLAWISNLYKLLPQVFLSKQLGHLIRWDAHEEAEITVDFGASEEEKLVFEIHSKDENTRETSSISIGTQTAPIVTENVAKPVFIPPKEALTLTSWLPGLYEKYSLAIDRTYFDLCNLLSSPLLRKLDASIQPVISALEVLMQGKIRFEDNQFFLYRSEEERLEIDLAAEGIRKLGVLAYLLGNSSLEKATTLFWDEPEANLNPAMLRELAKALAALAKQGFQIILATHSMSLLKEFHILSRHENIRPLPIRYFGLNAEPGQPTTVVTKDDFKFLPDVVALEVELEQADDLEEIFAREDQ